MSITRKTILVTGASGFIGRHVVTKLLAKDCEVHAVSRRTNDESREGVRRWHVDLTDTSRVQEIVKIIAPDKIIHLASQVSGNRSVDFVMPILQNNLISAVGLMLAASSLARTRVILAGSLEEPVYGENPQIPVSPYAAAKWAASGYARMFHSLYGLDVATVRIAMVYGPGQSDSTKLVPYVVRSILSGETPKLGSGMRSVDWVYVEDVADGLVRACFSEQTDWDNLDLGSGKRHSIRDVVERLVTIGNPLIVPQYGEIPDRALEQDWLADVGTTEKLIGWRAITNLDKGLSETVKWYLEHMEFNGK